MKTELSKAFKLLREGWGEPRNLDVDTQFN